MPTLIKRSNGIYYAILTDDHGRRKWISTRERKQSLAIKKIDALSSEEIVETQTTTLEDFRRDFIACSTSVLFTFIRCGIPVRHGLCRTGFQLRM